jgi:dolichol-phosphate mannosyltransferase
VPLISRANERANDSSASTEIIIAALNEELGICPTINELLESLPSTHVLVVDGHSGDRTVEVAKNCGAEIVFQDGLGKGDALSKALKVVDLDGKYVVFTDADYTYPGWFVPEMIKIMEENEEVGMVCGNRFGGDMDGEAFVGSFVFGNKVLAFAHRLLNGVALQDPLTGLRVVRSEVLKDWFVKSKGFDVEIELNRFVARKGFKIVEIPISYRKRLGEKKLKFKDGVVILRRILLGTV